MYEQTQTAIPAHCITCGRSPKNPTAIMIVNKGASARIVVEILSGMCAIALYVKSQLPPTITDFIIKKK